jgi:hypothetical protein
MSDEMTTASPPEGGTTRRKLLTGMGAATAGAGILTVAGTQTANAEVFDGRYFSFGPFREIDTRSGFGGRISGGQTRNFTMLAGAEFAMAGNLTVVNTSGAGYLTIYSADIARPTPFSSVNWYASGQTVANFTVFDLGDAGFNVYCGNGSTHFIFDSIGYFETAVAVQAEQGPRRQ